ncbi:hypothetical protein V1264_004877 [Littorina saxatilis]|uniref:SPRY domain-containing protein n=1 Tax=Littorina saxatilis TaxID=31220 RepID=A0AAN9G7C8_9CAEN
MHSDKPQQQPHGGIITTMHEMSENVMYAIRLNRAEDFKRKGQHLPCGVVVKSTVGRQDTARWGWDSAVVLSDAVYDRGQKKDGSALGDKLVGLPTGSEVGVMIDSLRRLRLFINEKDVITISDVTIPYSPCYAFFDIDWGYTQVSTLPPKQVQKKCQPTGDVTFFQ